MRKTVGTNTTSPINSAGRLARLLLVILTSVSAPISLCNCFHGVHFVVEDAHIVQTLDFTEVAFFIA